MASAAEMTSVFRDFALKKLNEAKARGATLATATAATAASITSNVAVPAAATSFVFRSNATRDQEKEPLPLDKKLAMLKDANAALKKRASDHQTDTLEGAIGKMDLINESMAFTIENIQECSHMMKMMHRQLREVGAMQHEDDVLFYKKTAASTSAPSTRDATSVEDSST